MNIRWEIKKYNNLSKEEFYNILKLRIDVFIVEQNCPYADIDGKDLDAKHIMGYDSENNLIAYCRILKPGVLFNEPAIGRVVTSAKARGLGVGKELMKIAVLEIKKTHKESAIRISAQLYLKKFYEELGFKKVSDEYLEDNIPHIQMLKQ